MIGIPIAVAYGGEGEKGETGRGGKGEREGGEGGEAQGKHKFHSKLTLVRISKYYILILYTLYNNLSNKYKRRGEGGGTGTCEEREGRGRGREEWWGGRKGG